jgi:hypothetical protein
MVGTFRRAPALLNDYKQNHPEQGYPVFLPDLGIDRRVGKFFNVYYTPLRSRPDAPADDYLITAVPKRWCCGFAMSLAMRSDGLVHQNFDQRPATLADKPLPNP